MDIQVNDISKIYGAGESKVTALHHANMQIRPGDFISIMGPSGSGKSTLLHIISGLDTPTSGQVLYGDTDIHHGSDRELSAFRRRKIGFIFQHFNLLPVLSAQIAEHSHYLTAAFAVQIPGGLVGKDNIWVCD